MVFHTEEQNRKSFGCPTQGEVLDRLHVVSWGLLNPIHHTCYGGLRSSAFRIAGELCRGFASIGQPTRTCKHVHAPRTRITAAAMATSATATFVSAANFSDVEECIDMSLGECVYLYEAQDRAAPQHYDCAIPCCQALCSIEQRPWRRNA